MSHQPRKRFGQNFLHDQSVISAILAAVNPQPSQALLEIGPGLGALTWPLLDAVGQLTVVEIDRDLAARLRRQLSVRQAATPAGRPPPELTVIEQDVLQLEPGVRDDGQPWRLIGNLPYNISTPLLIHLLQFRHCIADIHVMLQKEVVDRIAAPCGTRDYGRLSVLMQCFFSVTPLFVVPPEAFDPAPAVQSGVIRLVPRTQPLLENARHLSQVTRIAFASRRKTLRNNLRGQLDAAALERAGIDPAARAETLTLEQFVILAGLLPDGSGPDHTAATQSP